MFRPNFQHGQASENRAFRFDQIRDGSSCRNATGLTCNTDRLPYNPPTYTPHGTKKTSNGRGKNPILLIQFGVSKILNTVSKLTQSATMDAAPIAGVSHTPSLKKRTF